MVESMGSECLIGINGVRVFDYAEESFTLEQISELSGDVVLEFGTPWCGHCQAASPAIEEAVMEHAGLRHIKIYDGKGKRLGRAFKVKLWPTLILLHDGNEMGRLVRPLRSDQVRQFLSL
ncbi:Thioredoxin related protein [Methylophaga thiooxydans]|uniref:Thioredoxin related protein n=1 Tax=Methylophaga thiooxydans TaxID=392484 RepID=A0A0A0BGT9_9GAMM|nr:thioredoxin family protein [Methylophaga thiooxydans]KGM06299.1 Thioredoxin related protein [Methylophaga thiooxydans]